MREIPRDLANVYVTWVLYATSGHTSVADAILKDDLARRKIMAVARHMRTVTPIVRRLVYRGILLEPDEAEAGLVPDPALMFESWTTLRAAAEWFADPNSQPSRFARVQQPDVQGYIASRRIAPESVMWHHAWKRIPTEGGQAIDIADAALLHPDIQPISPQTLWNMRTQREVIVLPSLTTYPLEPVGNVDTAALDAQFFPPFMERCEL